MIIGHQKQRQFLEKAFKSKTISHALLFAGRQGLGKKALALEFLKSIFKKETLQETDFIFLEPVNGEIKIAQIRDLNWKLSLKSFSQQFKAAIINDAHLMNQEAQNCFLKTLEEPKGDTILFLISEYPELLLLTIRSRIQKINFYPVAKKEIEDFLEKQGLLSEETKIISEISAGRPGVALDLVRNPEKLKNFKQKIKEITGVLNSDLAQRFRYVKDLPQESFKETLDIWMNYFRNMLLSKLGLEKNWANLRKEYSLEKIRDILKKTQNTIFITSTTNVNQRLAMEILLMEL